MENRSRLQIDRMEQSVLPMASTALETGQLETATRLYQRLLDVNPESAEARMGLGQVAFRKGDASEAARWHLAAVVYAARTEQRHAALLAHGRAALEAGQLEAARKSFTQLSHPDEQADIDSAAWGLNGAGLAWLLEGDLRAAIAHMERAVRKAPTVPAFRANLKRALALFQESDMPSDPPAPAHEEDEFTEASALLAGAEPEQSGDPSVFAASPSSEPSSADSPVTILHRSPEAADAAHPEQPFTAVRKPALAERMPSEPPPSEVVVDPVDEAPDAEFPVLASQERYRPDGGLPAEGSGMDLETPLDVPADDAADPIAAAIPEMAEAVQTLAHDADDLFEWRDDEMAEAPDVFLMGTPDTAPDAPSAEAPASFAQDSTDAASADEAPLSLETASPDEREAAPPEPAPASPAVQYQVWLVREDGGLLVQFAAYAYRTAAQHWSRRLRELSDAELRITEVLVDGGVLYRLRSGPLSGMREAEDLVRQVAPLGFTMG